ANVAGLREKAEKILAESDYDHKLEHSIEFQSLFLKYLFKGNEIRLIPVLCGSLQYFLPEYSRQAFLDLAGPFLERLRLIVAKEGTLIIAGVDFSHIGPKFGHEVPAKQLQTEAEEHDSALLAALGRQDPDQFWEVSRQAGDRYNVCGFSALACLLEVLPACRSELLHYEMWHEEPTESAVAFAALNFQDDGQGLQGVRDNVTI
ncbi:MAG: AmmeMemoRadiSam system protein B, partial [Thermodesulfobacteriota bacterium]